MTVFYIYVLRTTVHNTNHMGFMPNMELVAMAHTKPVAKGREVVDPQKMV